MEQGLLVRVTRVFIFFRNYIRKIVLSIDCTEVSIIGWMCGCMSKERRLSAEIRGQLVDN